MHNIFTIDRYYSGKVLHLSGVRDRPSFRSKVFMFFILSFILIAYSQYRPSKSSVVLSLNVTDFDRAVQLITRLRSNQTSMRGLKYRSMICALVRNDPHLLEFLLRHLIIGFSHIVIYDNNRVNAGYDMDIKSLLAPFISAGVVTHVPWGQDTIDLLEDGMKNGNGVECLTKYGKNADWVAVLDTDEYFYYEKDSNSVNVLEKLLTHLEQINVCGILVKWSMMYGEGKILKQNKTLFEAYPRICGIHVSGKILARPDKANFIIPHGVSCKDNRYTTMLFALNSSYNLQLIHYYSKSIEEFLVKADQSVTPFIREVIKSYDLGPTCNLIRMNYSKYYQNLFLHTYNEMNVMHSLEPKYLLPTSSRNIRNIGDYSLYIFMKYQCAKRHEFDHEKYLSINKDARTNVENGTMVDGLYHFMFNFRQDVKGCWQGDTYSFCE